MLQAENINKRLAEKGNFEYVSGYKGVNSKMTLRCKDCGNEFKRSGSVLYSKSEKLRCPHCNPWLQKDKMKIKKAKFLEAQIERNKELEIVHKKNKALIELFSENWLALYICITTNESVDKANADMGIKPKYAECKYLDDKRKSNAVKWNKVDRKIKYLLQKGYSINKAASEVGLSANTLYTRRRFLKQQGVTAWG